MAFDVSGLVLDTRRLSLSETFFKLPLGALAAVGLELAAVGEATIASVSESGAANDLARAGGRGGCFLLRPLQLWTRIE